MVDFQTENEHLSAPLTMTTTTTKPNIPFLHTNFVLPKIGDINIQKTLADLSPEPPSPNQPGMATSASKPPFLLENITKTSSTGIKFVQLVLEQPKLVSQQDKKINKKRHKDIKEEIKQEPVSNYNVNRSEPINDICTICGQQYNDKSAFNAHIRAHLKEKLSSRIQRIKKEKSEEEQNQRNAVISPSPSSKRKLEMTSPTVNQVKKEIKLEEPSPEFSRILDSSDINPENLATSAFSNVNSLPVNNTNTCSNQNNTILCTPDISDIEEDFLNCEFSAEMEINRNDLNNDLSSILDQIEKDFEGHSINLEDVNLDTPPDSDSEASDYLSSIFNSDDTLPSTPESNIMETLPGINTIGLSKDHQSPYMMVPPRLAENPEIEHNNLDDATGGIHSEFQSFLDMHLQLDSKEKEKTPLEVQLDTLRGHTETDHDYLVKSPHLVGVPSPVISASSPGASVPSPAIHETGISIVSPMESQLSVNAANTLKNATSLISTMAGRTPPASPQTQTLQRGNTNVGQLGLTKFASLPAKAIAVLNQLPGKLLLQRSGTDQRIVNVFKVEKTGNGQTMPSTVINVECNQETQKEGGISFGANIANAKIIETTRSADGEKEYKIVLGVERDVSKVKSSTAKSKQSAECNVCGKSITTKNMARHMEKHTGKKKFQCEICQASFFQKTHLKNHVILHENGEYHECKECKQKFLRKADFQRHQKTVHFLDIPFNCNLCGAQFSDHYKFEIHKKAHIVEKKELCGLCGEKFEDKNAMVAHMKQHTATTVISEKSFTCTICHKNFSQKGHLNRHSKSHGPDADLICMVCSKQCKNKVELQRHRASHLACQTCSAVFDNKIMLQQHILRNHPGTHLQLQDQPPKRYLSPASLSSCDLSFLDEDDSSSCSMSGSPLDISPGHSSLGSPEEHNLDRLDLLDKFGDVSSLEFLADCHDHSTLLPSLDKSLNRDSGLDFSGGTSHFSASFLGESLDDISDSSFFDISRQMNDEIYTTDLFASVK